MCSGCGGRFDEDEDGKAEFRGDAGADRQGEDGCQVDETLILDADDFDVWVGADRIVERRVIRAK